MALGTSEHPYVKEKRKGRSVLLRPFVVSLRPTCYLIVKYQDFVPTFFAASVATILTVFLPLPRLGEL